MAQVWKCLLDSKAVLTGYQQIDDAAKLPDDIIFAQKPDLAPGEYRWDGMAFVPAKITFYPRDDGPDMYRALYFALMTLARERKGTPQQFPQPVLLWLNYFRRAFTKDDPL